MFSKMKNHLSADKWFFIFEIAEKGNRCCLSFEVLIQTKSP